MELSEIFYSLQGESSYAGLPCIFIRLAGCNLRCSYCDTTYAYNTQFTLSIEEIIDEVKKFQSVKLIEITGGEPLLQKDTIRLLTLLLEKNYKVLLETNNSISLAEVPMEVIKIVDIKTPSSDMSDKMLWDNFKILNNHDEIKFVIGDRIDFDWALGIIKKYDLKRFQLLFSPVFEKLESAKLAEWILETRLPIRMNVQLHKVLWGNKRGK
ncbi:MAG TPA: radical SAM protein [Candidatus Cloacimonetes bacterium]|nr:radical SAM protein [Candidatus Cloacimonadota bacterium]HEX38150.1 radical SAM protein [Candidatus Cloacimonadota bacterium]